MTWQNVPMLRLLIPLMAGMGTAYMSEGYISTASPLLIGGLAVCGTAAIMLYRQKGFNYLDYSFGTAVFIFTFLSGVFLFGRTFNKAKSYNIENASYIEGIADEAPKEHAKTWSVKLKLDNASSVIAYISKKSTNNPENICIGDSIRAEVWKAENTYVGYEGDKDDVISSYKKYLFLHHVTGTCFAYNWEKSGGKASTLSSRLHSMQQKMAEKYSEAGFNKEEEAVISAMTIGDKRGMDAKLKSQYSKAGVSHVLALSGFHLTIIYSLLDILLLGRFADRRFRWVSKGISIVALWAFAIMAGLQPSLTRSVIMCSMLLIGSMFGITSHQSVNSLAVAGIGMLIYDPFMLFDIGFQFSFISVFSLCLFSARMKKFLSGINNVVMKYLAGAACTSLVATATSFPLTAYYFNQIPITGIISNIAVTTIASAVLMLSMLWWAISPLGNIQEFVTRILDWMLKLMNSITEYISSLDFSTLEWKASALDTVLAYALITAIWMTLESPTKKRWYGLAVTANVFGIVLVLEAVL